MAVRDDAAAQSTGVGTSWETVTTLNPHEDLEEVMALFEHTGDSDLADFRLRAKYAEEGETSSFVTLITKTGIANGDEPVLVKGNETAPDTLEVQAKAQSNTVDVLGMIISTKDEG